jgi:general secretion pathway protein M
MSMQQFQQFQQMVLNFWQGREPRERKMMAAGAMALALVLVYLIGIAPAQLGISRLQKALPQLRLQAASMQALASQAQQLNTTLPPPAVLSTHDTIQASLMRRGLKAQSVVVTADQVRIQLNNASFAMLIEWLDEIQKSARLSVVETSFTSLAEHDSQQSSEQGFQQNSQQNPQLDKVQATVVLRQPKTDDKP